MAALEAWRRVLRAPLPSVATPAGGRAAYEALAGGTVPAGLDADTFFTAKALCVERDLSVDELIRPVRAAWAFQGAASFPDWPALEAFIDDWAGSHAVLLARLAGAEGRWQGPAARSLGRGFFQVGLLLALPGDAAVDRLFIAQADLEKGGVDVERLRTGRLDEPARRVLWKQSVRARDAFAQGQGLIQELERPFRAELKRAWIGALALLDEIERRGFDVWSRPIVLTPVQRFQLRVLSVIGRGVSRRR